jgi:hypothetical protein
MADADLDDWIAAARSSLLASFAAGIYRDLAAVRAAIATPWSNGQTEGQITRAKLIKRQMYGRAKIDLPQARLVGVVEEPIVGLAVDKVNPGCGTNSYSQSCASCFGSRRRRVQALGWRKYVERRRIPSLREATDRV